MHAGEVAAGFEQGLLRFRQAQQGLMTEKRLAAGFEPYAEALANALFDRKLAEEEVWIRQGIKARRTRNEGRVRALETMRRERAARRERVGSAKIGAGAAAPSGRRVIDVDDIYFAYGDRAIWLTPAQKQAFAGNAITLSDARVWMSAGAAAALTTEQYDTLAGYGFAVGAVELSEIEKAGGRLRCCVGEIY